MDRLVGGYSGDFTELSIRNFYSDYEGMNQRVESLIWGINQACLKNHNLSLGEFLNRYVPEHNVSYNGFIGRYNQLFADPSINRSMTKLQELKTELDRVIAVAQEHLFRSTSVSKSGAAGSLLGKLVLDFDLEVNRLCNTIDRMIQEIKIVPGRTNRETLTTMLDQASSWVMNEYEKLHHTFKGLSIDPEKKPQFERIEQKKINFFDAAGEARLWLETIDLIPSPRGLAGSIFGSSGDLLTVSSLPLRRPRLCTMDEGDEESSSFGSPPASSPPASLPPSSFKESLKIQNQQTQTVKTEYSDFFLRKGPEFKDIVLKELGEALETIPVSGKLTPSQISEFQRVFGSDLYVEYTYHVRPGVTTSLTRKINNAYYWAGQ